MESNEPIEAAIDKWLAYNKRHTDRTQAHYKMVIMRFQKCCPKYAKDLTFEHIERYLDSVVKSSTNRTANNHTTVIQSFCRWLSEHYDMPNPTAKIKLLRENPPNARVLTHDEYLKVLSVCKNNGETDVIKFIGNTGLRLTEVRELVWGNISPDMRFISFTGKGRKHRLVPLNNTCREILSRNSTTMNFLKSYRSRPALYRSCCRLADRASIPMFGPHALRHYFATRLMQKGVPIAKISRLLGHSSISTTERIYIHWLPDDMAGLTDVLDIN